MAKWVIRAALLGFLIGGFWMVMAFVFFTAEPQGGLWTLYFLALIITCPAWFLPIFPFTSIANSRAAASPPQSQS